MSESKNENKQKQKQETAISIALRLLCGIMKKEWKSVEERNKNMREKE